MQNLWNTHTALSRAIFSERSDLRRLSPPSIAPFDWHWTKMWVQACWHANISVTDGHHTFAMLAIFTLHSKLLFVTKCEERTNDDATADQTNRKTQTQEYVQKYNQQLSRKLFIDGFRVCVSVCLKQRPNREKITHTRQTTLSHSLTSIPCA